MSSFPSPWLCASRFKLIPGVHRTTTYLFRTSTLQHIDDKGLRGHPTPPRDNQIPYPNRRLRPRYDLAEKPEDGLA